MSDLIRRQDAIEKMEALADDDNLTPDEARGLSWCIRAIETLPKAIDIYPDGTMVVRVEDIEKGGRVLVETGHYCKMFYEEASDED
jgi:hypothetical protein